MDDIVLPPLPPLPMDTGMMSSWLDQIRRAAVIADRKQRAEPKSKIAYKAVIYLAHDGLARFIDGGYPTAARPTINWTNDGRVWIESDDHREVAHGLRGTASWLQSQSETALAAICRRAANLLDGGEPC